MQSCLHLQKKALTLFQFKYFQNKKKPLYSQYNRLMKQIHFKTNGSCKDYPMSYSPKFFPSYRSKRKVNWHLHVGFGTSLFYRNGQILDLVLMLSHIIPCQIITLYPNSCVMFNLIMLKLLARGLPPEDMDPRFVLTLWCESNDSNSPIAYGNLIEKKWCKIEILNKYFRFD
ncbi:hypothetical protein BDA99DRAFT_540268 [Phascolomyces articulosus]|uniref:Uncharacterized protein n=1 Tax=Phascolomyces articulosus TaxID=60185 RepID=A0AAD5PCM2_9FUNG|nr:hypothetical protein BDA99DRAFT_540268 [Phascolomyces articulosus]